MVAPLARENRLNSITLTCSALLIAAVVASAGATSDGGSAGQFTSGVNVIEVYASVVDRNGDPVRGLTRNDFELLEDGSPQQIQAFAAGDFPLTVALALDRSFSMEGKPLEGVKSAARAFLGALRPSDESLIVGIGSEVALLAPQTASRDEQRGAVQQLTAWGTTALHDAIIASVDAVDAAKGRRALVILSDGDDRYSKATAAQAIARARQSNVMVYPVALGRRRPELFAEMATVTGGRSYHAREPQALEKTLTRIAEQLKEQYLLGYSPSRPAARDANEWRAITVRVSRPGVTVRARDGYYAR